MKSLKDYITIYEGDAAVSSIEKAVVDNPKDVNMMSLKESPLDYKKVGKLNPKQFADIFGNQTIVIFCPVSNIASFGNGQFEEKAKDKKSVFFNDPAIIFITNISEESCNVVSIEFNRFFTEKIHKAYHGPSYGGGKETENIDTPDVISSIAALRLGAFNKSQFKPKLFVVDAKYAIQGMRRSNSWVKNFFKPYTEKFDKIEELSGEMLSKCHDIWGKCKEINLQNLRKGTTWNYLVIGWKEYDLCLVGYDKALFIGRQSMNIPTITRPSSVNTGLFRDGNLGAYRINDKIYQKLETIINEYMDKMIAAKKDVTEFRDKWMKKYILGEPVDIENAEKESEKEIEKQGNQNPETNNNPNSGSEKVKGSKKKIADAEAKMDAWHEGTRKQNLKNCSDDKLKMNYQICKDKGYDKEADQIEAEAKSRGLKLTESVDESLLDIASKIQENIEE